MWDTLLDRQIFAKFRSSRILLKMIFKTFLIFHKIDESEWRQFGLSVLCICICLFTFVYLYSCIYICVFVFEYLYLSICNLSICILVFVFEYLHLCIYISVFVFVYSHLCICIWVFVFEYLYLSIYICVFTLVYLYLSTHICVFVFDYLHLCICFCIYIYTNQMRVSEPSEAAAASLALSFTRHRLCAAWAARSDHLIIAHRTNTHSEKTQITLTNTVRKRTFTRQHCHLRKGFKNPSHGIRPLGKKIMERGVPPPILDGTRKIFAKNSLYCPKTQFLGLFLTPKKNNGKGGYPP